MIKLSGTNTRPVCEQCGIVLPLKYSEIFYKDGLRTEKPTYRGRVGLMLYCSKECLKQKIKEVKNNV